MDQLAALQCAITENNLLLAHVGDKLGPAATGEQIWDLVHALRFRGWLCDNLGLQTPPALAATLNSIDAGYRSPQISDSGTAIALLGTVGEILLRATPTDVTTPWTIRQPYFKPNHRSLADWVWFMASHEAYHLGRASPR
jgi:hypothetical protein